MAGDVVPVLDIDAVQAMAAEVALLDAAAYHPDEDAVIADPLHPVVIVGFLLMLTEALLAEIDAGVVAKILENHCLWC